MSLTSSRHSVSSCRPFGRVCPPINTGGHLRKTDNTSLRRCRQQTVEIKFRRDRVSLSPFTCKCSRCRFPFFGSAGRSFSQPPPILRRGHKAPRWFRYSCFSSSLFFSLPLSYAARLERFPVIQPISSPLPPPTSLLGAQLRRLDASPQVVNNLTSSARSSADKLPRENASSG